MRSEPGQITIGRRRPTAVSDLDLLARLGTQEDRETALLGLIANSGAVF